MERNDEAAFRLADYEDTEGKERSIKFQLAVEDRIRKPFPFDNVFINGQIICESTK